MKILVQKTLKNRSFTELQNLITFDDRFEYLVLKGIVGASTFGFDRYLNQQLYTSYRWLKVRDQVIIRDDGCDLGIPGYGIRTKIVIHHMNPISPEDLEHGNDIVFDPEFLISTSHMTHRAIHFGDKSLLPELPIRRRPGDTCPWRR
jgi:hypothetical protein